MPDRRSVIVNAAFSSMSMQRIKSVVDTSAMSFASRMEGPVPPWPIIWRPQRSPCGEVDKESVARFLGDNGKSPNRNIGLTLQHDATPT